MKFRYYIVLVLVIVVFSSMVSAEDYLEGSTFEEVATKKQEIITNLGIKKDFGITYTLIHPEEKISFNKSYLNIEEELKTRFNLIHVSCYLRDDYSFRLYEFKNKIKVFVDNKPIKIIDFYDVKTSRQILGYLLLPKVIDINKHKTVKITHKLHENGQAVVFNLEKYNKLVKLMQE